MWIPTAESVGTAGPPSGLQLPTAWTRDAGEGGEGRPPLSWEGSSNLRTLCLPFPGSEASSGTQKLQTKEGPQAPCSSGPAQARILLLCALQPPRPQAQKPGHEPLWSGGHASLSGEHRLPLKFFASLSLKSRPTPSAQPPQSPFPADTVQPPGCNATVGHLEGVCSRAGSDSESQGRR